jgi:type I restriction enzyme S subunit
MDDRIVASDIGRYKVVRKDWFAYNPMRLNIGSIARWQGDTDILVSPDYIVFSCLNEQEPGLQSAFLDQFRQSAAWENFVTQGGGGSVRIRIYYDDIGILKLNLPVLTEQQKIAECLSSADEAIAAQARKVDALKKHKKGLMQQLFPREGDTQPHRRFPEFQNAGEWRRERLQEVTDSVFDGTHQTPAYTAEGVPFYSVENLISGNANKFISRSDYILATNKNKPTKGDILLTRIGKIGYSRVVTWDHDFSVYVTLAVIKQSKLFNSHYMSCFIQSEFYQSELRRKSLPDAVPPKINLDNLRSTTVLLPNEDEQRKLADCFTALDHLIIAETQKAEALKRHKRGLMQQLFPLAEEAKG